MVLQRIMIANYMPLHADPHVPRIVQRLRKDFDDRLMELYKEAIERAKNEPVSAAETVHVPYAVDGLHVTAVFHEPTGHFTQLIARSQREEGEERPSFTISLFLTTVTPE